MLAISFDELTKENLQEHSYFFTGTTYIRFCIDITDKVILLCGEKEDHIVVAEFWLSNEKDISKFDADQIAGALKNHIVGGAVFIDPQKPDYAFILIGNTSLEQGLRMKNNLHTVEAFDIAEAEVKSLFAKFYSSIKIKAVSK